MVAEMHRPVRDWLTIHEAADELGCGSRKAYDLARSGELRGAVLYLNRWRIPPRAIGDFLSRVAEGRPTG